MTEFLLLALPALCVVVVAIVVSRQEWRQRSARGFDDVETPAVSVAGVDWAPAPTALVLPRDGALVDPDDRTLGGRMRAAAPPPPMRKRSTPTVRIRRRQLVAAPSDA